MTRDGDIACCLVLAAGSSRRLGRPKQLLPYRGRPLLAATLERVQQVAASQLLVTLGGASDEVTDQVPLDGCELVHVRDHASGCSSSIVAALPRVDPQAPGVVLFLGDQPEVDPAVVRELVDVAQGHDLGVCRYDDGLGHPLWLGRGIFGRLAQLHGDKGVWRLVDHHPDLVEVRVPGHIPLDVDTEADYRRLVASGPDDG